VHPRRAAIRPLFNADPNLARSVLGFSADIPIWRPSSHSGSFFGLEQRALTNATQRCRSWRPHVPRSGLTGYRRIEYLVGAAIWLAFLVYFWAWWLQSGALHKPWGLRAGYLDLAWVTLLPAYFVILFYRALKPAGSLELASGCRVAMVVTKLSCDRYALKAMLVR